jgi:hypothetical protein
MGKFILAQHDADKVISLDPSDYRVRPNLHPVTFFISYCIWTHMQGHYMQALALGNLGYHREALVAMLKALDLDLNATHANMLTDSIAHMANEYSPMPEQLLVNLEGVLLSQIFTLNIVCSTIVSHSFGSSKEAH